MKTAVTLFLLFVPLFSVQLFSQAILKQPELPESYQQWPNVFQRTIPIQDKHVLNVRIYVRKETGKRPERLALFSIDRDFNLIMTSYISHGSTDPESTQLLLPAGFLKQASSEIKQKTWNEWQEYVANKFGIEPAKFEVAQSKLLVKRTQDDIDWFFRNLVESDPR